MKLTTKALLKSFFGNLFLSIVKVIIGFVGNSSALVADGIHSFSDLATDSVALFGAYYSNKPADEEHPFGHGRVEYLTCLIIGIVVLFLGYQIIVSALNTNYVIPSKLVILVSLFTIIFKYFLAAYLIRVGKKENNQILISSGRESSMDVISSLFVLLSGILMQFSKEYSILKYSNLVATLIVGVLIVKTGFDILKDNFSAILGENEVEENINKMKNVIKNENKIIDIDSFVALKNGPYLQITGEVSMESTLSLQEVHDTLEKVEEDLKDFDNRIRYINIHVNPVQIKKEIQKRSKNHKSKKNRTTTEKI